MENSILIRYGELFLKGKNKYIFENILFKNIKNQLSEYEFNIYKISARIVLNKYDNSLEKNIISKLVNIFGLHSVSPAKTLKTNKESIMEYVSTIKLPENTTFKIDVNRADKTFELKSMEFERLLGGVVLENNNSLSVKLNNPDNTISVDIRENGETFIFFETFKANGGLPVGSAGDALLLLSGGIDSPVAGYKMAKRGLGIHAIHYHSFPYTSEMAKEKVITLASILSEYTGPINLHIIPFTKIQEEIHKHCKSEYMITIMRRFMMRIAERVAVENNLGALITGESLGQVASQTMQSMMVTGDAVENLPVFRPLIADDKEEIIEIAKKINTYETSILPYEDCCTVFLPDNPIIKPKLDKVIQEEAYLNIDELVNDAVSNKTVVKATK